MLLKFEEQIIHGFLIPAFTLSEREIVIIQVPGGGYFDSVKYALGNLFSDKVTNAEVEIHAPFKYVDFVKQGWFKSCFTSQTVEGYIAENGSPEKEWALALFDTGNIMPNQKVETLWDADAFWKQLAICTTLSYTKNIVFDLIGVGPLAGIGIYSFVKKTIEEQGGTAILIDHCDEFKSPCTRLIEAKYVGTD